MTLTDRARHAAEATRQADPGGFDTRFADPIAWKARARYAINLAVMLGIDPADVTVRDDPDRRYGARYPVPLLHVPDTSRTGSGELPGDGSPAGWWFIPETGDRDSFLALGPCPACGGQVPVARIASIADLGDLIGRDLGRWDDPAAPASDRLPIEFDGDPGHHPGCPHHDHRPAKEGETA
jgi:hypothetical protein